MYAGYPVSVVHRVGISAILRAFRPSLREDPAGISHVPASPSDANIVRMDPHYVHCTHFYTLFLTSLLVLAGFAHPVNAPSTSITTF